MYEGHTGEDYKNLLITEPNLEKIAIYKKELSGVVTIF